MASPVIDQTIAQITATDNVIDSAITAFGAVAQMITDAVNQALANGASADQLQPVSDAVTVLKTKTDALAVAIASPTPPTPQQKAKMKLKP